MTLVIVSGFEPLAYRLGGGRSIQLSYTIRLFRLPEIISQTRNAIKTGFRKHYDQRDQYKIERKSVNILGF